MKCGTPYQQQKQFLLENNIDKCPNEVLREDLAGSIRNWMKKGDSIVVLADCNEDIRKGKLTEKMQDVGLHSPIRQKFGDENMPATYHAGSRPIDEIFISRDLNFKAVGYLPFGDGPGDHRGIFIGIFKDSMIGDSINAIHRQQGRKLKSTDIRTVEKFNNLMKGYLRDQNIFQRMDKLDLACHSSITESQMEEFVLIDKAFVGAFKYANKRCKKLKSGEVAYAPEEIQVQGRKIRLWTFCIRKRCGRRISSSLIRRLAKKLKITHPLNYSLEDMKEKRTEARKSYDRLKPNSREIRDNWLLKLADWRAKSDEIEAERIIKSIRRIEEIRDVHRKIIYARGKINASGTAKLIIPNTDGPGSEEITDKEKIEDILMRTNKSKFQQAADTPFVNSPLVEDFGPRGLTVESENILTGTYSIPNDLDDGTQEFIEAVRMDMKILKSGTIQTEISEYEHKAYWKNARESTQSSMSGIHFGVYKSITKDDELLNFSTKLTNLPFRVGYSSERNRKDLNLTL